jgi:protease-4
MGDMTDQPPKTTVTGGPRIPLTWKGFLISAVIILVLYLFVRSLVGEKPAEDHSAKPGTDGYEYTVVEGDDTADASILAVPVSGIILTEPTSDAGIFDFLSEEGVTYGYDVKESLKRAAEDDSIKAVILEINSPGGTIPGSKAISDGVEYYRKATGNPVYAHITDVGASGGYWAAAATDRIYSEIGSEIGSIGVIMGPFKYYDGVMSEGSLFGSVETENGIESRYFTAGQYKDTGSPYRRLSEEEVAHWQRALDNEYARFVAHVATRRGLSEDTIRGTVKALPYETTRALALGLIDGEASREEATNALADAAGLEEYNVIMEDPVMNVFDELFGGVAGMSRGDRPVAGCSWCGKPLYLYDKTYRIGM